MCVVVPDAEELALPAARAAAMALFTDVKSLVAFEVVAVVLPPPPVPLLWKDGLSLALIVVATLAAR